MIDLESVRAVELPIGSGEVIEEGPVVTIQERVHTVQVPGDVQAANLQVTGGNSVRSSAEFSVNAIGPTDLGRTKLDTIDTIYRQTFSAFNSFVCGITTVCLLDT